MNHVLRGKAKMHLICRGCWDERRPREVAVMILGDVAKLPCCYCAQRTSSGLYISAEPGEHEHATQMELAVLVGRAFSNRR